MDGEQRYGVFRERRNRILEELGDDVLVLFSAPITLRNNDVDHDYRQSSDFHYLTGFVEPESVLVLRRAEPRTILFLREKDPERETWDGRRLGVEAAPAALGIDVAFPIEKLPTLLPDFLENVPRVHASFDEDTMVDPRLRAAIFAVRGRRRKRVDAPREIVDAAGLVHEARLFKSAQEVEWMRRAAQITRRGHEAAMLAARPGVTEFEIQTVVEATFRAGGSRRLAYSSIVGAGVNGTILHYRENESTLQSGQLVLIDAGAEFAYYAADITRTFPVDGRFTPVQRRAYEAVLEAQLRAIEATVAGNTLDDVHEAAVAVLLRGAIELGLVSASSVDPRKDLTKYYMHRTSHYLGMDVHDVGRYYARGEPRRLAPGMVITVEPGLYVAENDDGAPEGLRGLGIRIEDDVLVTEGPPDVLSAGTPKTVEEIEAFMAASASPVRAEA